MWPLIQYFVGGPNILRSNVTIREKILSRASPLALSTQMDTWTDDFTKFKTGLCISYLCKKFGAYDLSPT